LNVHRVNDVRIHEPVVPFDVEVAIAKLKMYKSLGSDQILAELIEAGGESFCSKIRKLINYICNTEELPDQWKESITYFTNLQEG
jgi:hypothetical protein